MTMTVAIYDELPMAQRAVTALLACGYAREAISVLVRSRALVGHVSEGDAGPLARAATSATVRRVLGGGPLGASLADSLEGPREVVSYTLVAAGMSRAGARFFADAICDGAILVAVHCGDDAVEPARTILDFVYSEPVPHPGAAYVTHRQHLD